MTDWHLIHLGHLALSGAALLTIEATAVVPEGRITYADVGLFNPRWPWHAAAHFGASVRAPNQYLRSQPRQYRDLFDVGE
jgi:2,4-dienoyl-CoA reductase-like NADH-dependent reductase (Old Yellow Enzyme family)